MNKVQMIELLKLRNITKLDKGQSIGGAIQESDGEPSLSEMVKVNEATFLYYIKENNKLCEENEKLQKRSDEDSEELRFLNCLRVAGVDNWDGYEIAQDEFQCGMDDE